MDKKLIVITTLVGSFIGGYIPSLWDANILSLSGVFFTAIGGIIGIWVGYQMNQ